MHYSERLKEEANALRAIIAKHDEKLAQLICFLQTSPKFQGVDLDGSRKDWISTSDIVKKLQEIRAE